MNRLILVRHGESEHHVRALTGGWTDTPLTELGRLQAQAAAARCKHIVSHDESPCLYSSDLLRAAQTAECVSRALDIPYQVAPGLREISNGIALDLSLEEAKKIELPVTESRYEWVRYPEAESFAMLTDRVFEEMQRIDRDCPTTAIVVSHGNAGVAIIQWWLGLDDRFRQTISFDLDPASITELSINEWHERTIVRLNDTAHLGLLPST